MGKHEATTTTTIPTTTPVAAPISTNGSCPLPSGVESLNITGTAHDPMMYVAAACAAVTLLSAVGLICLHLCRYRVPKEQRQIVRICLAPFVFAIVSWGQIYNYNFAAFINPIGNLYEAFCLCALYLLYIQFAVPAATFNEDMFTAMADAADVPVKAKEGNWPKLGWVLVFQYPITETVALIILEATEAAEIYCSESLKPEFGHLWYSLISTIGVALCVMAIFRFYGRMKRLMKARRGMWKLLCFKGIVFLRFVQTWIFSILMNKNALKTSTQFSYGDWTYGLPNVLVAAEMVLFSLSFWFAYSASEYSSDAKPLESPSTFFYAMLDAMNPTDVFLGMVRMVPLIGALGQRGSGGRSGYYPSRPRQPYDSVSGPQSRSSYEPAKEYASIEAVRWDQTEIRVKVLLAMRAPVERNEMITAT